MPRYAITTVFNEAELKRIEETARMLGFTKYRLMREATIKYCEDCLKHDREKRGQLEERNSGDRRAKDERTPSGTIGSSEGFKPPFIA